MPKFTVTGTVTISVHVDVEADTEAEARDKATDAPMMTLCQQCASGDRSVWSTSGELDGTPIIEAVRLLEPRAARAQGRR